MNSREFLLLESFVPEKGLGINIKANFFFEEFLKQIYMYIYGIEEEFISEFGNLKRT